MALDVTFNGRARCCHRWSGQQPARHRRWTSVQPVLEAVDRRDCLRCSTRRLGASAATGSPLQPLQRSE